jgi:ankyrin repeat protein
MLPLSDVALLLEPLLHACRSGDDRQVCRLIWHTAKTAGQPPSGNGNGESLNSSLVNTQHPESGLTPLSVACSAGHIKVVRLLLQAGASCYEHDAQDISPLMWAARGGHHAVTQVRTIVTDMLSFAPRLSVDDAPSIC